MDSFRAAAFVRLNGTDELTALLATTTSIYHRRARLGAAFPFIIFQKQSGTSRWSFEGKPLIEQVWMFKAVDQSPSASKAEDIDGLIDTALTDAELTLSDGDLLYLRRESDIDYEEGSDPDYAFHHVGGLYRVVINRE